MTLSPTTSRLLLFPGARYDLADKCGARWATTIGGGGRPVMISTGAKPVANPLVIFREEFDDWAVLFDPDTGSAFGVDPVGALVWKHLDGVRTIQDMLAEIKMRCNGVPEEAETHIKDFVQSLLDKGLAGLEIPKG